jgi:hypothetical protein
MAIVTYRNIDTWKIASAEKELISPTLNEYSWFGMAQLRPIIGNYHVAPYFCPEARLFLRILVTFL